MKKALIFLAALTMLLAFMPTAYGTETITCWFPPGWKSKGVKAKAITTALTKESGIRVRPRIAKSYPEILQAFHKEEPSLVYVGSFVQTIIHARGLGTPLVQSINGKEFYSGIMIYPKGEDPDTILKNYPDKIAFTIGASSGESSARAATNGKASFGVANHGAAARAVKAGKAKAAVVKNWWWGSNKEKFPTLTTYNIPEVSIEKNPDNVLTASKSTPADITKKITGAAIAAKDVFGAREMVPFDQQGIEFSLALMKRGKIDPLTYSWE